MKILRIGAITIASLLSVALAIYPKPVIATMSIPLGPKHDIGTGEKLIVVVAGEYPTRAEAEAANDSFHFGDLAGFVAARTDWFTAMKPGGWALVSAFRTASGAGSFESLAGIAGAKHLRRVVTRYTGKQWIGLGQEEKPDGSGPLVSSR
ncbi:MAG: hypothetical protein NVSMB57_10980 [Actinomycetota bacterium]